MKVLINYWFTPFFFLWYANIFKIIVARLPFQIVNLKSECIVFIFQGGNSFFQAANPVVLLQYLFFHRLNLLQHLVFCDSILSNLALMCFSILSEPFLPYQWQTIRVFNWSLIVELMLPLASSTLVGEGERGVPTTLNLFFSMSPLRASQNEFLCESEANVARSETVKLLQVLKKHVKALMCCSLAPPFKTFPTWQYSIFYVSLHMCKVLKTLPSPPPAACLDILRAD